MHESSEYELSTRPPAGANGRKIRVVIADDHPVILLGARHALARFPDIEVVGEARQSTDLVKTLTSVPCDALVTDLAMPGGLHGDGLPLIGYVRRHFPALPIVVLTMLENAALIRRLGEMGVIAVVSKSDDLAHIGLVISGAVGARGRRSASCDRTTSAGRFGAFVARNRGRAAFRVRDDSQGDCREPSSKHQDG
jgi:two-component system, NarL family, captular synthesis response regulator RcsB